MRGKISNRIHESISFVKGEDSIEGQEIHEDGLHGSKVYLPLSTRRTSLNFSIKGAISHNEPHIIKCGAFEFAGQF
jgi:hypothetical protein